MGVALLLIYTLLRPAPVPVSPMVVREAQRPPLLIVIATAAPTMTPAPTMPPIVEVQVVQSPPEVVYVEVPVYQEAPVVEAAPTPEQQYQAASERQQNIQSRLIEIPTIAPMEMNPVNQEWAAEQYRSEHP
jgi:hypothetical protein